MERTCRNSLKIAAVVAGIVVGLWGSQQSSQAGEVVTVDAGVDFYSKYVWRGMQLTDGPVLQPSATVSAYGLSLNVWASLDITDENEGNEGTNEYHIQELDYTLSYGFAPLEGVDMEVGLIHYTFPGTAYDSTEEAYLSVGLSCVPLSPSVTVYWDFDEVADATGGEGIYITASVEQGFELTEKLGLTLGATLGYGNQEYYEFYNAPAAGSILTASDSAVSDLLLTASLSYAVTEDVSLGLNVGYSTMLDSDIDDLSDENYQNDSILFAGVSLGVSF